MVGQYRVPQTQAPRAAGPNGWKRVLSAGSVGTRAEREAVPDQNRPRLGVTSQGHWAPLSSDPSSFEEFYRAHLRSVAAVVYALTGSRWGAEDVTQEAFLAAHRKWERVSQYDRPDLWIRRVATNLAASRVRRSVAEAKALLRLAGVRRSVPHELPAQDAEFWQQVSLLPPRQAQAVVLRYVEDRPLGEIAEILGCAEGTVKSHLARGRAALAVRLGLSLSEGE